MKWEYLVVQIEQSGYCLVDEDKYYRGEGGWQNINVLGAEGWELTTASWETGAAPRHGIAIFKRPVAQPVDGANQPDRGCEGD